MSNKIKYYSTDKLYQIKGKVISKNLLMGISCCMTFLAIILCIISFLNSTSINTTDSFINYVESGDVDYKIYLKDNDYYDTSFLKKGMLYVASLIKTINVDFKYRVNSDEELNYIYDYKITGELQITDKDDSSKVLFTKNELFDSGNNITVKNKGFSINGDIDIDYDKYNNYVNSYKKDYGLTVKSNLIVTMEINTKGSFEGVENELNKNSKMQIKIPLSEQTINITMDANGLKDNGTLVNTNSLFKITNPVLFGVTLFLLVVITGGIILIVSLYNRYFKKDIYRTKVNKILRDYDRIIVSGKTTIDEAKYSNKIQPDKFEEMVDAAQTLNVPILFYEVIPGEKCFFIIAKDDTLYKYRLTKAFLEKNLDNIKDDLLDEKVVKKAISKVKKTKTESKKNSNSKVKKADTSKTKKASKSTKADK